MDVHARQIASDDEVDDEALVTSMLVLDKSVEIPKEGDPDLQAALEQTSFDRLGSRPSGLNMAADLIFG